MTPEGVFSSALIANPQAQHIFEVFCHPFTAGETIAQSKLGALRVNGQTARAQVVDRLGNGDYIVRITVLEEEPRADHRRLELVRGEPGVAGGDCVVADASGRG